MSQAFKYKIGDRVKMLTVSTIMTVVDFGYAGVDIPYSTCAWYTHHGDIVEADIANACLLKAENDHSSN